MAKNKKYYQEFKNALADFRQRVADGKYAEIVRPSDGVVMVMPKVNSDEKEALEAQVTQAADDSAGKEAYKEVKAEVNKVQCPECFGDGERWNLTCNMCNGDGYVIEVPDAKQDETAQLRAEIEALKAENLRLTAGIADAKEIVNGIKLHDHDFAIFSAVSNLNVIFHELEEQAPAPTAQAASEVTLSESVIAELAPIWNAKRDGFDVHKINCTQAAIEVLKPVGGYIWKFEDEYDTPTNRAAISARRKALGLGE